MQTIEPLTVVRVQGDGIVDGVYDHPRIEATRFEAYHGELRTPPGDSHAWGLFISPGAVACPSGLYPLAANMFFSLPGGFSIRGGSGLLIRCEGHRGQTLFGGPLEAFGRLSHIDGATASILVGPDTKGDPALVQIHIPAGCALTEQRHQELRISVVARGSGMLRWGDEEAAELRPGMVWVTSPRESYRIETKAHPLDLVQWHPLTVTGPHDGNHPALNQSIVAGVAADQLPNIQTRNLDQEQPSQAIANAGTVPMGSGRRRKK